MPETQTRTKSEELFAKAKDLMPGGVNSPVRAFKSVGGSPIFIKSAKGSKIYDVDGKEYIDYIGSWGPMILGHADDDIEANLITAIKNGTSFGTPTEIENEMAEEVIKLVPSIEMVRMVNSGTEAVLSAIRLARAYTKRPKILKFSGCYHGHADSMLVQAGSGVATLGLPDSPGVTADAAKNTITVPFNDKEALREAFKTCNSHAGKECDNASCSIAALILEPVIGNAGLILPEPGYLEFLRELTKEYGVLLIFDEVMTGFRVALGGAQEYFNIEPDLTTLGKIIGGGLPVGAYGGRREIMEMVAPAGPMYQAGTLSGNPLAMTAGLTCLKKIQEPGFYDELDKKSKYLIDGMKAASKEVPMQFSHLGGMFGFFFSAEKVKNYEDAKNADLDFFKKYYAAMLDEGIYLAPSAFEAGFMSAAHSYEDLDKTIEAHKKVLEKLF